VPALALLARPGPVEVVPGPRLHQEEQPLLSQLLLLLWDSACAACHALRAALALLPCLVASCLAVAPAPLPRLAPDRLAALLALAAEAAGPVYVKLAQWAATRRDLLPEAVCLGLARLQTQAAPHPWSATERTLREDFGPHFKDFFGRLWLEDRRPVASGCCAQVYHGWLDGREVAVKVVHPNLRRQLQLDLHILQGLARLVTWLLPSAAWLALPAAVTEFEALMTGQLDMMQEARNLDRFRENFKDNDDIVFPEPLTEFCRR
jgi:aarF domain-containing kinase